MKEVERFIKDGLEVTIKIGECYKIRDKTLIVHSIEHEGENNNHSKGIQRENGTRHLVEKYCNRKIDMWNIRSFKVKKKTWLGSLLETLSRSERPYALRDNCSCQTKVHWLHKQMFFTFGNNVYLQRL